MRLYLAGGISGNLKPAWRVCVESLSGESAWREVSQALEEALKTEGFWQGGSHGIGCRM